MCPVPTHAVVMLLSPVPDTVTTVPGGPLAGEMEAIYGCAVLGAVVVVPVPLLPDALPVPLVPAVKARPLNPQRLPFPRAISPVTASLGTVIWTVVSLTFVICASCPDPIHAAVIPVRPVPDTVTTVPAAPCVGVNDEIVGCLLTAATDFVIGATALRASRNKNV